MHDILAELSEIPIEIWYLIIILSIIEFSLMFYALYDWFKADNRYMPNRKTWLLMILFVNMFGPIVYFWIAPRNSGNKLIFDDEDDLEKSEVYEFKG